MKNSVITPNRSKQASHNMYVLIIFIILLCHFTALAGDLSEQGILLDPKLAIKYPISLNTNYNDVNIDNKLEQQEGLKSKGRAFLFSLIIPGAGEYYVGKKNIAKTFFITELVLWAGYFSFQTYSNWKRDDMYMFAATHAQASIEGKPSQYFVDIGNYQNIFEYNDAKQRQREFYKVYPEEDYYWLWDNAENQRKFEQMRISSDRAHNRSIFAIGSIIANHVLSAIDAVWQTYKYNKKIGKALNQKGVHIYFGNNKSPDNFFLTIQKKF